MRRELLIGCGHNKAKQFGIIGREEWAHVTTLDMNPAVEPDLVWNLDDLPLPFHDNTFDEIHAYEVLEHCGRQGDWRAFFALFDELHRILKPGGHIIASTPAWDGPWAWGDPGHTRIIDWQQLTFLDRSRYEADVGNTPMTDYRPYFRSDYEVVAYQRIENIVRWVLEARK